MRCRLAVLPLFLLASVHGQEYDLVLSGGRIVDGSGNPWYEADLAVSGDRIAAIGRLAGAAAKQKIDARGLVIAPGFIDIHTHARGGIFRTPTAENYVRQGVATLIEGQDGGSPWPTGAFLKKLAEAGISVNFGIFAGQGTIRQAVIGLENRRATADEIRKMKELVRQAMQEGALGLSSGLFYVPGNFTPPEEVVELAAAAGESGGIYISHIRDEAAGILDSVKETIRIGEEGRLPAQITHHKIIGTRNWGKSEETLRLVEEARSRGVDVTIDQYPYTASFTGTAALFPQWALAGGRKQFLARLEDPAARARIVAEIVERIRFDRGGGDPKNVVMAYCPDQPELVAKDLGQITRERGRESTPENAAETAIEIQRKGGCSAVFHAIDEGDLERILRYPLTMIASDGEIPEFGQGAPHPRSYGAFARVLGRYVRERRVLRLEDAVRKMTSLPANRLGLADRGLLRPGMKADLAIFDANAIADTATFTDPHHYAVGVLHVLVNGRFVLQEGRITEERPGSVLYGPGSRR
ncbi:MAG: D-aminoacylase [Bryobacterales bacterium]|nr:D-aminoacylase [Bryobacterales bacterium]